jgi:hypothetical protein
MHLCDANHNYEIYNSGSQGAVALYLRKNSDDAHFSIHTSRSGNNAKNNFASLAAAGTAYNTKVSGPPSHIVGNFTAPIFYAINVTPQVKEGNAVSSGTSENLVLVTGNAPDISADLITAAGTKWNGSIFKNSADTDNGSGVTTQQNAAIATYKNNLQFNWSA